MSAYYKTMLDRLYGLKQEYQEAIKIADNYSGFCLVVPRYKNFVLNNLFNENWQKDFLEQNKDKYKDFEYSRYAILFSHQTYSIRDTVNMHQQIRLDYLDYLINYFKEKIENEQGSSQ